MPFVFSACEVSDVNQALSVASKVMGGSSSSSVSSSSSRNPSIWGSIARITPQQQAQISSVLTRSIANSQLRLMASEAQPVIQFFLEAASCQFSGNAGGFTLEGISRVVSSNNRTKAAWGNTFHRVTAPNHHPMDKCLTVSRIDSWQKEANNAFSFQVLFLSDYSGNSTSKKIVMRKEDGEWRVYDFD